MLGALAGSPATYFLALIIAVSAALPSLGQRVLRLGPMALAAVAMYVVSTGIVTSYRYVPGDWQVNWWTASLLIVSLCYLGILSFRGERNEMAAMILAVAALAMFTGAAMTNEPLLQKTFWFLQFAAITGIAFACYLTVARDDTIGQMTWGVLFIAEGISAVQIVDCQFLHGMFSRSISEGSACEQVYGWVGASYMPMALPTLLLIWIVYRCLKSRKS